MNELTKIDFDITSGLYCQNDIVKPFICDIAVCFVDKIDALK